jgi:hypothetical protein
MDYNYRRQAHYVTVSTETNIGRLDIQLQRKCQSDELVNVTIV